MEQASGTSTLGNTKPSVPKRRNHMVTFWTTEYPKELPKNVKYMCTCEDICPTTGKWHGHAFIYFINPVGLKAVKKLFGDDAHVEKPLKNSDAINYVLDTTKNKSNFKEYGKRPNNNGVRYTVEELKKIDDPNDLDWTMYNTWKKIKNEESAIIDIDDWKKDVKVYYIFGPSGIGKTEKAKQIVRENKEKYGTKINRVKYDGNFWLNVRNDIKIAVYDDFRDSHMKPSEFVNFIDYNKQPMNIKGGSILNNYELIIITSVQNIEDIYRNITGEPREQWKRRIEVVDMTPKGEIEDWT